MNILMATDEYLPLVGGLEYSIEIIAYKLRQLGHRVSILAPEFPNLPPEESVIRLKSLPSLFGRGDRFSVPFPKATMRSLEHSSWDVIHIHTPYHIGHISYALAKKTNTPCIFTCHSLQEYFTHSIPVLPQSLLRWGARFWNRRFCNLMDAVIAPSQDTRTILLAQKVTKPIFSLSTPIDKTFFGAVTAKSPYEDQLNFLPQHQICLYTGQIAKEKNLLFLIDAFKLVHNAMTEVRLVLIGDGPFREELQRYIIAQGLEDYVVITGYLPRKELSSWYSHATLFLFPSMIETQGMVVSEALIFGLPPLIVDGTGTREVVSSGINGLTIKPDKRAYAQKVIKLLKNTPLREQLARNALTSVANESSLAMETLLQIYTETASRKRMFQI